MNPFILSLKTYGINVQIHQHSAYQVVVSLNNPVFFGHRRGRLFLFSGVRYQTTGAPPMYGVAADDALRIEYSSLLTGRFPTPRPAGH